MTNKEPLVSVVMPIKACTSSYLEKSIASILTQTYTNLELIVITEATDVSLNESTLFKFTHDKRLRVVENKDKGFVNALNYGISISKGSLIARMDGDDVSLPDRLKLQVTAIQNTPLDIVGGWAYLIDESGLTVGRLTPPFESQKIRRRIMLHNPFLHSAMLFKKSILLQTGLYNKALYGAEDYDLWLRVISFGYRYANLPNYLVCLRQTNDSVMRGSKWKVTRLNYSKVKALGFTRLGYRDPLSVSFALTGPLSLLISPRMAVKLKSLFNRIDMPN